MTLFWSLTGLANLMDHMLSKTSPSITKSVFSNQSPMVSVNLEKCVFRSNIESEGAWWVWMMWVSWNGGRVSEGKDTLRKKGGERDGGESLQRSRWMAATHVYTHTHTHITTSDQWLRALSKVGYFWTSHQSLLGISAKRGVTLTAVFFFLSDHFTPPSSFFHEDTQTLTTIFTSTQSCVCY